MSRSNPQTEVQPNPSTRWLEWNGAAGNLRYYDKAKKENVDVALPFQFILLDQTGKVTGWHEASKSGIYSNEVRDTRQDVLLVKSFKHGTLVEGVYRDIKDKVRAVGGHFTANCYIAFKNGADLVLGAVEFKSAGLNAWLEFVKASKEDLYSKAIKVYGYAEGKKGAITYRIPQFKAVDITPESEAAAQALDKELQEYLKGYFARRTPERAAAAAAPPPAEPPPPEPPPPEPPAADPMAQSTWDDDIPFAWLLALVLPCLSVLS